MRKILTSFAIFLLAFFVFSITQVSAKIVQDQTGTVVIGKTEVINDDLFIGAQVVEISGTVNGDVFIGAQAAKITGVINGSLHVGANTIDLGGKIKGNVYAGAQNILVNGANISGSLLVGGATLSIDKTSVVEGSLLVGAASVSIDSQVGRSVYAGTGSLTIGGETKIGKDLYYAIGEGQAQANISSSAKISGNVYKSEAKTPEKDVAAIQKLTPSFIKGIRVGSMIISFAGALVVGFLYLQLFGRHLTQTAGLVSKSFWKSLGVGFLVSIAFIPGFIILLISVVGIPLAGLSLLALLLYSYLAKIVVGSALGAWLSQRFNWKTSALGALALGLFAFYVLKMIQMAGFLVCLVVLWAGLGALTLKMFSKSD